MRCLIASVKAVASAAESFLPISKRQWIIFDPHVRELARYSLKPALTKPSLRSALSFSVNGAVSQRGKRSTGKPRSFISSQKTPRPWVLQIFADHLHEPGQQIVLLLRRFQSPALRLRTFLRRLRERR